MYYWTILNFNKTTFAQVAAIEDAEIITDFCPKKTMRLNFEHKRLLWRYPNDLYCHTQPIN